jgi:hypothetical protein
MKRENLCCSNTLSAAVKGFCVNHFLSNGSLSPSYTFSCYQSINARRIHTIGEERKFVVEPFVRLSVHLSILCCLFSVTLLLCICAYVRVYKLYSHLLSLSCVHIHTHTYTRTGGRKVVQRSISLSHVLSASIVHSLTLCKDQNSYTRIRQTGRQTSNCCSQSMFLQVNMHINDSDKEEEEEKEKSIDLN